MATHSQFCWLLKLMLFLLLMMSRALIIDTRPARSTPTSELIAGDEFLKLFLERDDTQRDFHSTDYQMGDAGGVDVGVNSATNEDDNNVNNAKNNKDSTTKATTSRSISGERSLNYKKVKNGRVKTVNDEDEVKQVVKLVTSGSKIVFLEEYDDNDAIVDAVAREIDLQKEKSLQKSRSEQRRQRNLSPNDEVKVVAVSVSSSSKRGGGQRRPVTLVDSAVTKRVTKFSEILQHSEQVSAPSRKQQRSSVTSSLTTAKPTKAITTTMTTTTLASLSASNTVDFINRSHKSEFSIEEAEPLTMLQRSSKSKTGAAPDGTLDVLDEIDSENSASTNIHNVLAVPLVQTDATRSKTYRGGNSSRKNSTNHFINHTVSTSKHTHVDSHDNDSEQLATAVGLVEDKLLPFQTVIYHDTKESHGPQSRSISYSSISQNVDDIHAWQRTGILAEAQRNVNESLKSLPPSTQHPSTDTQSHISEPAKFYSVPAKMYGVPAKFYSEPSKVYSEPAKVYGQPEKFYSEPAKNYGEPSKFYGEPSKVYGEPAKTYWPNSPTAATTTTTTTTSTTTSSTISPTSKIIATYPTIYPYSRRPAIVSRIAFGEAQTSTTIPPTSTPIPTAAPPSPHQHHHHQPHQHQRQHSHYSHHTNSQSRRVLFNLDKLPYDLLNAPEQSSKHLLDPDFTNTPPAAVTYSSPRERQCLESAFTASAQSSISTSQQQQQSQHSSLSNQHSNQNTKGLPNRDLVKCVSKYSHSSLPSSSQQSQSSHHYSSSTTTESSHIVDLYTPTPEQNYEIEESVSVMTNGRAHGVQQGLGSATTTAPKTSATTKPISHRRTQHYYGSRLGARGGNGGVAVYNANANTNDASIKDVADDDGEVEVAAGNKPENDHNNNYDNIEVDGDTVGNKKKSKSKSNGNGDGNGDDDDDSKVAYVVEGRNYRKYRVEEKTDDGFIVGEYGVVDHNDGNFSGVRYTADSTINPSLIHKALLTFLKLK